MYVGYAPRWSLFDDMHRLQRELNRLLTGMGETGSATRFPAVNVRQNKDAVVLEAEVPGIDPAQISVTLQRTTVTLSGSRAPGKTGENDLVHRQERFTGEFTRTFELPCRVDENAVHASCKNGILTLVMPRAAEDKPKTITINAV